MADEQCGLGLSGQKNKACVWSYNGEFNLQEIKMNIEQVIGHKSDSLHALLRSFYTSFAH